MIWLDGLDVPPVNHLGATFSEKFDEQCDLETRPAEDSRARYGSGLLPLQRSPQGITRRSSAILMTGRGKLSKRFRELMSGTRAMG
jgi:gentisate 1,2-dioxygenase